MEAAPSLLHSGSFSPVSWTLYLNVVREYYSEDRLGSRITAPMITRSLSHMESSQPEMPHSSSRASEVLRSGPASCEVFAQKERWKRKRVTLSFLRHNHICSQSVLSGATEAERGAWGGCLGGDPFTQHTKAFCWSRRKQR